MPQPKILSLILCLCVAISVSASPKPAKLSVESSLYSLPESSSKVITKLPEGSEVTIEQRQGGWYQIKTQSPAQQGWVRSYDVQVNPNINWLSRLKSVISGGYGVDTSATATIGVRGLGPGDLKKAAPDLNELKKLDSYQSSVEQGLLYASGVPLKSNEVAYLQAPTSTGNAFENTTEGLGDVVDGIGDSLGGAVDGLKGLFGGDE